MERFILKNSAPFVKERDLLGVAPWQILKNAIPTAQEIETLSQLRYPCVLIEDVYPLLQESDLRPLETALLCGESLAVYGAYALQEEDALAALYPNRNGAALTSSAAYSAALNALNRRVIAKWQNCGVLFEDPQTTRVDFTVTIGKNARIFGGNVLLGATSVGENCLLYPNNFLRNATVQAGAVLTSSTLQNCVVGEGAAVGPNANLREGTTVGDFARIGDFVELKNAQIGARTKIAHLTYVGDATVGANCNFGCGVVVANFDGKRKHRTAIGNDCFIGCNVNLVAPLTVGDGAFIAAGTTVTESVENDAFVIGRPRPTVRKKTSLRGKRSDWQNEQTSKP